MKVLQSVITMQSGLSSTLDDNFTIVEKSILFRGNPAAISYFEVKQYSKLEYYSLKFIFYETIANYIKQLPKCLRTTGSLRHHKYRHLFICSLRNSNKHYYSGRETDYNSSLDLAYCNIISDWPRWSLLKCYLMELDESMRDLRVSNHRKHWHSLCVQFMRVRI